MHDTLPDLIYEDLVPTREYLRNCALIIGALQRAYLPKDPHLWQYGLEVNMRGPATQAFKIGSHETRASLDLVTHKLRLDGSKWLFMEYDTPELLKNVRVWLESKQAGKFEEPELTPGARYDKNQAEKYASALWWLDVQFRQLAIGLKSGLISPILLYPHHFDLALSWFPQNDEKQLTIGWSTGDDNIPESYLYITAYPEPAGFGQQQLPEGARWQTKGFSGTVLPYWALAETANPAELFQQFAAMLTTPRF